MAIKSGVYELALVESQCQSLGGTVPLLLCLGCAEDGGIDPNSSVAEVRHDNPDLFEILCDGCGETLWSSDDERMNASPYDTDDFGPADSDPYEGDRDEYEPGGCYWDREPEEPPARHTIHGNTLAGGKVQAHHWTNDNLDRGYPTEDANWIQTYPSIDAFRQICGITRQGIGCYVEVWLDGLQQFEPEEMARLERVEDLGKHLSGELTRLLGEFPGATYAEVAAAVARRAEVA